MKVSWNWLSELCPVELSVEEAARRLTMVGLEVEGIERRGEQFSGVVVAEILEKGPHPKSQKLTLVKLSDGQGTHDVVCGAPNVPAPGAHVLWARPGAKLPGGIEIGSKEVVGVRSAGMICSETELAIGDDTSGIVILGAKYLGDHTPKPGEAAQDALGLRDVVLELNVTPNRGDWLGHLGVARELAAATGAKLRRPEVSLDKFYGTREAAQAVAVTIEDPEGCPRYVARLLEGLTIGPAPRWMRRRLEAVGVRPISNLVDVTNYVMLELGQPLHAFDYDKVQDGKIIVRRARVGEKLVTLDDQERVLEAGDLVIADPSGPVALAGVMGGLSTEVGEGTTRVLLESASFQSPSVRRTARRLALHSEASHRFERGVDPSGSDYASQRAARLLCEVGGGKIARGAVDAHPRPRQPAALTLRPARANALLGLNLPVAEMAQHLRALELDVAEDKAGGTLRVTCPTFRPDLEREVDLIEEIARLGGLERLPATLPVTQAAPQTGKHTVEERVRDALAAAGLSEFIGFGFTSPSRVAALRHPEGHPAARYLALKNPLREEQSVMRTSLLSNLLGAVARNLSFGVADVRLFEVGHVFLPSGQKLPDEPLFAAGVITGQRSGWLKAGGAVDFFDAKGVVENLFASLKLPVEFVSARNEDGFLHPGVGAALLVGGQHVGVVGEVHPETRDRFGIEPVTFVFELNLERLPALKPVQLAAIPRYPAIVRDVSFFCDDFQPAARIRQLIDEGRPALLEDVFVLDDYREAGKVPEGKKGMLWSMTYRAPDRTLTDAEVDAVHEALVTKLLGSLGAERR